MENSSWHFFCGYAWIILMDHAFLHVSNRAMKPTSIITLFFFCCCSWFPCSPYSSFLLLGGFELWPYLESTRGRVWSAVCPNSADRFSIWTGKLHQVTRNGQKTYLRGTSQSSSHRLSQFSAQEASQVNLKFSGDGDPSSCPGITPVALKCFNEIYFWLRTTKDGDTTFGVWVARHKGCKGIPLQRLHWFPKVTARGFLATQCCLQINIPTYVLHIFVYSGKM